MLVVEHVLHDVDGTAEVAWASAIEDDETAVEGFMGGGGEDLGLASGDGALQDVPEAVYETLVLLLDEAVLQDCPREGVGGWGWEVCVW